MADDQIMMVSHYNINIHSSFPWRLARSLVSRQKRLHGRLPTSTCHKMRHTPQSTLVVVPLRALISDPASVARLWRASLPECRRRRKKMRYMREYMPENQAETKCVYTPPEPRKGVYQDALRCLKRRNDGIPGMFKRCLRKQNRRRRRIAKQNFKNAIGEECKQAPIIVLFSLRRTPKRA